MVKSFWSLVVILGLIASGCTYEVTNMNEDDNELPQDQPRQSNGGILDKTPSRSVLLGDTKILAPKVPNATAVTAVFQQDFSWQQVSADDLANPQMIVLMPEVFPITALGQSQGNVWQLVFNYGTGNALSGGGESTGSLIFAPNKDENVVDVNFGTSICIPSASFSFKFRLLAYSTGGFVGTNPAAPTVRASLSMGYGNKTNSRQATATEPFGHINTAGFPVTPMPMANGDATIFRRPKYSNAVSITWQTYNDPAATPSQIDFLTDNGTPIISLSVPANLTAVPIYQIPASTVYVRFSNSTGGPISLVMATFFLDL